MYILIKFITKEGEEEVLLSSDNGEECSFVSTDKLISINMNKNPMGYVVEYLHQNADSITFVHEDILKSLKEEYEISCRNGLINKENSALNFLKSKNIFPSEERNQETLKETISVEELEHLGFGEELLKQKEEKLSKILDGFNQVAYKYNFNVKIDKNNNIILQAKNTDANYVDWIIYSVSENKIYLWGNTDQLNIWFCETRKDMTPDKIQEFVRDLNQHICNELDKEILLQTLIDPEDWQVIASVKDAYQDERYIWENDILLEEKDEKELEETEPDI